MVCSVELTKKEVLALIAMAFGVLMDGLDASIVSIALPSIAQSFGTDTSEVAWVTIMYFMMIAGLMLTFGRIADSGKIKTVYIIGFGIFSVSSLACGLSDNLTTLVASRAVQGIGAAMIGSVAPMICVKFLPPRKLGIAMSVLMLAGSIGFGSGPAIGGFIVDMASWHWAFFINVPIGLLAIVFAVRALPKDEPGRKTKLDVRGCTLLFLAVICGVYSLEMFSKEGHGAICIVAAMAMVVFLTLFIREEGRAAHPMLNLRMFKLWRFNVSMLCYLILNICYMGLSYVLPFYLTKELGLSYSFSGLLLLLPSAITMVVSLPAGRYADSHGRHLLAMLAVVCLLLTSVGYALVTPEMGWLPFIPMGIFSGIVWGFAGASITARIVDFAPPEDRGIAASISNFLYYVGGSIGTALFASLVTLGAGSSGIPVEDLSVESFMDGFTFTMLWAVGMAVIAVVSAWVLNENRKRPS
jgi:EmrB/QacA subfamily drug resistance transporter